MVKSKKLSKSSLAVIILSLLLILSMIVGMTAAWFTSTDSDSKDNQTFATVKVSLIDGAAQIKKADDVYVLPGDSLADFVITNESNVQIYARYKVSFTVQSVVGDDESGTNKAALQSYLNTLFDGNWLYVMDAGSAGSSQAGSATESEGARIADGAEMYVAGVELEGGKIGNTAQGAVVTVAITVEAIQAEHFAGATEAWAAYTANGLTA